MSLFQAVGQEDVQPFIAAEIISAFGQFDRDIGRSSLEVLQERLAAVNEEIDRVTKKSRAQLAVEEAFTRLTRLPFMSVEDLMAQRERILAAIELLVRAEAAVGRLPV